MQVKATITLGSQTILHTFLRGLMKLRCSKQIVFLISVLKMLFV